jgi:hypothetical protein
MHARQQRTRAMLMLDLKTITRGCCPDATVATSKWLCATTIVRVYAFGYCGGEEGGGEIDDGEMT